MTSCARCGGAEADFHIPGEGAFCGSACLELQRRDVPSDPNEAPLRLTGRERIDAVDELLDARAEAELDRLERQAMLSAKTLADQAERFRYRMPRVDRYGRVASVDDGTHQEASMTSDPLYDGPTPG